MQTLLVELNRELPRPISPEVFSQWKLIYAPGQPGRLEIREDKVCIRYADLAQLCRLIGMAAEQEQDGSWEESRHFEELSFMLDCSRNAVPRVRTVEKLLRRMALMGYNALLLYTEDVYTLESYPYFGHLRGRYSRQELCQIDDYASRLGIEVIPCIQTLAHLNGIFHWPAFQKVRDTGDILLCDDDETQKLIRAMIKECGSIFRSRKIHIGMDEAEMVGKGKYHALHGYVPRYDIILRHLNKVAEICQEEGLRPMMWSDMFIKDLRDLPEAEYQLRLEQMRSRIPETVTLVHWDYYARNQEKYDRSLRQHLDMTDRVCFAGGAWKWSGFAPLLDHSMLASRLALASCLKTGIRRVMVTGWGDDGAECGLWVVLPILQLYAETCYRGDADLPVDLLEQRLYACTGSSWHWLMACSQINYIPGNPSPGMLSSGPEKYHLYQDPLLGIFDRHVPPDSSRHYRQCMQIMDKAVRQDPGEALTYRCLEELCRVLSLKSDFGIRLRKAYHSGDHTALCVLRDQCGEIQAALDGFLAALKQRWMEENKPFGFEVLDLRLGGLKQRMATAEATLKDYLDGTLPSIAELEEKPLYYVPCSQDTGEYPILENCQWRHMVTAAEI